ncbi:MAG: hypothetical protein M1820_005768 [Bogoriella megaspora]|nr:MAG: hypothetical protein M1820_005768 [Bogoriella megaspora]
MRLPVDLGALPASLLACLLLTPTWASGLNDHALRSHDVGKSSINARDSGPINITLPDGLVISITHQVQCSRRAKVGDTISVHYKGTLASNGEEFDSSYGGDPLQFTLGVGQVIKGWDEGLLDTCIGDQRRLTIPSTLAYGQAGAGSAIPPGATLIFDTELMGILGVDPENNSAESSSSTEATPTPTPGTDAGDLLPPTISEEDEEAFATIQTISPTSQPTSPAATTTSEDSSEGPLTQQAEDDGECHLLGPFAILVQGALGLLALVSLVFKRWRERPRRPLLIWFFDASKQVFGSALLHVANLLMSMLSSGKFDVQSAKPATEASDGKQPNPCSFYLLNLLIDTTVGIPILVLLLRVLHHLFSLTPLARPEGSLKSGYYGEPPRWTWWLKQSLIYFLGLLGMKFCVFILFQMLPWLVWVGNWLLAWTEGNTTLQIVFVMLIFPLIMNAIQYYIIDTFIKNHSGQEGGESGAEDHRDGQENDERGRLIAGDEALDQEEEIEEASQSESRKLNVNSEPRDELKEVSHSASSADTQRWQS